jgi:hypothetical protein
MLELQRARWLLRHSTAAHCAGVVLSATGAADGTPAGEPPAWPSAFD